MPHSTILHPDTRPPTLAETDELLAGLAQMPRSPEVTEVTDAVLDYRLRVMARRIAALESITGSLLWLMLRRHFGTEGR